MIVTLLVIKRYVEHFISNKDLGIFIFMSATIDIDLFSEYYEMTIDKTNLGYITRATEQYKRTKEYFSDGKL